MNRKDTEGKNLFSGGFLGLDNIGVFDRSQPLPTGGHLEQADGTAWMAFYCATMLSMALELARDDSAYEDIASKFFEHFVAIVDAMNTLGGTGLWDETGRLLLRPAARARPARAAARALDRRPHAALRRRAARSRVIDRLPGFSKRLEWFLENRPELAQYMTCREDDGHEQCTHRLLAIPSRERLERVLRYMLDESEFLSPYGIRSLSRVHKDQPYVFHVDGREHRVDYVPGESNSGLFGGNSNWRGPIWFPINYLLVEALERYHHFYGDTLRVECPTGSGTMMNLQEVAQRDRRAAWRGLFLPDASGRRPVTTATSAMPTDPHWRDLVLFHEYFHGDTGRGVGASHQTGWTALVARALEDLARARAPLGRSFDEDRRIVRRGGHPPCTVRCHRRRRRRRQPDGPRAPRRHLRRRREISIGKARTAALFKKPTAAFEDIINNGRTAMVALHDFTPLQGGIPIEVDGQVVGAIGVSGAANQQRDEEVAKAGAAAIR